MEKVVGEQNLALQQYKSSKLSRGLKLKHFGIQFAMHSFHFWYFLRNEIKE